MREILFKGKRLDDSSWAVGDYLAEDTEIAEAGISWILPEGEHEETRVYTATVGQFTGLVDKNGKKVFEGDILKIYRKADGMGTYYAPPLEYPVKVVVKWDMCAWMWETIEQYKYYIHFPDAWCHFECEVVGNIHDNPEMIERSEE